MKRLGLLIAVLAITISLIIAPPAKADVQDFLIKSFEADYFLSRDEQKNSQLRVEEKIVAEFPNFDQNHGILRAIPKTYKDHPLSLRVEKVTNEFGHPITFETSSSNSNEVLKIGDADKFVHGRQTYQIYYSLQHVTSNFEDHDEFYWDINGDQWRQSFEKVTVRLHIDKALVDSIKPGEACYTGAFGSSNQDCSISSIAQNDAVVITSNASRPLNAGETLTIVAAFQKDTFAPYKPDPAEVVKQTALIMGLGALPPFIALAVVLRSWHKYGRDPKGKGTIVPQYLAPKEVSVMAADAVMKEGSVPTAIPAQILDLAVRHFLKIYEVKTERKLLPDKTTYEVELVKDTVGLRQEELEVLRMLFGAMPKVGDRVDLKTLANKRYKEAAKLGKTVNTQITTDGYLRTEPGKAKLPYYIWGAILLVGGFFAIPYGLGVVAAGLVLLIGANYMPARTIKGVELRDYLYGLRDYMKLAEAERIKVLQSPHGTLTEKIDTGDNAQLVKLYEKLLPYAMLFGIEKDWAKQFADLYQQPPDWYVGSSAHFNGALFATSLHSFGTTSATSFSPPSNSSSSGVGGGFSGGGGGGGGGGGW